MTALDVEVVIERLVLRGLDRAEPHAVADAVTRELARLIEQRGDAPADADRVDVDGGTIRVGRGVDSDRVGARVARSVHARALPTNEGSTPSPRTAEGGGGR